MPYSAFVDAVEPMMTTVPPSASRGRNVPAPTARCEVAADDIAIAVVVEASHILAWHLRVQIDRYAKGGRSFEEAANSGSSRWRSPVRP
jgi:hypothetical protein